jgi:ABC-2 type transport system ATP-binding protein
LVICDSPRQIKAALPGEMVEFLTDEWQKVKTLVAKLPGVLEAQTYGEALHLLVDDGNKRLKQITKALTKSGIKFRGARVAPVRMEEAFISLIQRLEDDES